jgi:dienelactone hydrolase
MFDTVGSLRALIVPVVAASLVVTGCSSGEAESTGPAEGSANTIGADATTDIVEQEVAYDAGGVTLRGFIAYDASVEGQRPGVLVVHEWWGHNEHSRDRARALAELGYTALAVDMYGEGRQADHPDSAGAFASQVMQNLDEGVARFNAAKALLNAHETTDPNKTAAIGYCFGGAIVLHMARTGADLDAVAAFHTGSLETGNDASNIQGRVFVAHGADDPLVSPQTIASFKRNMDAAGVDYEFVAYPGAVHSFTNPDADAKGEEFGLPLAYQKEADEQSWAAMNAMFKEVFDD